MNMQLAWHHTNLPRAAFIMTDGVIRPSRLNPYGCKSMLPPDAAAVVWLTSDHRSDRTAAANGWLGEYRDARALPVRFGVPWSMTLAPGDLIGQHGWTAERLQLDTVSGVRRGAKPDLWRVVIGQVPVVDFVKQVKIRQGWRDIHPSDLDIIPFDAEPGAIRLRCYGIDMAIVPYTQDGRQAYAIRFDPDA